MKKTHENGQTAIEYLMLLAIVVGIVLAGFGDFLPRMQDAANIYYNKAAIGLLGEPNPCGDGTCGPFEDAEKCPVDC